MNAASTSPPLLPAATTWSRHLAGAPSSEPSGCSEPGAHPGLPLDAGLPTDSTLSMAEAQRVQRYRDRLMAAVQSQDRGALRSAKQDVLQAAFRSGSGVARPCANGSPAMRRALRDLCWRMAILVLPRQRGD